MKNIVLFSIVLVALLLGSCRKESELQKSVFIPDAEFPELPEYSEWGYNTFGAYYDRQAFVSNSYEVPMKVVVTNDSISFIFQGYKPGYGYNYADVLIMKICMANYEPLNYTELVSLNGVSFDLKADSCVVSFSNNEVTHIANILDGTLQFKRAQNLFVDDQQVEVILSGYIHFNAVVNQMPISINEGRFDVGIGETNFFNY